MRLDNKGKVLIEYLLIIAVISLVIVSLFKLLSGYIHDSFTKSSCELLKKTYVEGLKPGEGICQ